MNRRQLKKLGVPDPCLRTAIVATAKLAETGQRGKQIKAALTAALANPEGVSDDSPLAEFAKALIDYRDFRPAEPIEYAIWGEEGIDHASQHQMQEACRLPIARGAALMPDAHVGYGLPIGGVLACEGAVIPYAVGVDIACRMKLSIVDMAPDTLQSKHSCYVDALQRGTRFGVGVAYDRRQSHDVLDRDWTVSRVTRDNKDKAWRQLGTSGSGNHFVEFGTLELVSRDETLDLDPGTYVALLSHSGSRGTGAAVCSTYSAIAQSKLAPQHKSFGRLAWLELSSQEGQEYWQAMNLMGHYAAANHDVIHKNVTQLLGARIVAQVENHHNFAWLEEHGGDELVVHRKGATPAGEGVLGVIPGSMADPAFVVRGKGNAASLRSASHGAGRRMSRRQAKSTYNFRAENQKLEARGIHVISAGADEVPGVYKDIREVMQLQADLVEAVARFDPKVVKMCGDGSRAED